MKACYSLCILLLLQFGACLTVMAQASGIKLSFEKAYLHTDRDVYVLGDTLWFKAYLVNAQDNKPATSSGNLYVELIAPDSAKIINREIIRLENGLGKGDITLGDSVKAGRYQLRAYTNWMRNFGDNFIFEKDILILNAPADPAAKSKINTAIATAAATTPPASSPALTVHFYPEGGSLVEGLSAMVGVKAENTAGKGIPLSGVVLSVSGDTVSHFNCDSLGMGLLTMLPIAGQRYHAIAGKASFAFPKALSKGLGLQIRQTDSLIHAIVSNSDTIKTTNSLIVKHCGITLLSLQLQMKATPLAVGIPTATLPEGISAITLYNEQNKPECERLVYIHHQDNKHKVSVTTNKKAYQPKEQVTVNIQTQPNSSLSMAVLDASMVPVQTGNIISYLNLQSEIRGAIEKPDRYFDTTNVNRFKQLDMLLMTQGWRNFVWRRLADTVINISHAVENGITITGSIKGEDHSSAMPGLNLTLYTPDARGNKLYTGQTDSLGGFNFGDLLLDGQQRIRITSVNAKGEKRGNINLDTIAAVKLPSGSSVSSPASIATDTAVLSITAQRIATMKNANIRRVTKLKEVNIKAKSSIVTRSVNVLSPWGPDQVFDIKPEDAEYKTLEWYLLQHVSGARSSNSPGPTGIVFSGIDTGGYRASASSGDIGIRHGKSVLIPPLLFVNGKELDMDEPTQAESYRIAYFNMPITQFKHIVLKHMVGTMHGVKADGSLLSSGQESLIVDRFLLYLTLDRDAMTSNSGSLSTNINGYYKARDFYAPPLNSKPSVNDYRATVYWEPDIKTDAAGRAIINFYNAVPQTHVTVIIQGLTTTGTPIAANIGYEVK